MIEESPVDHSQSIPHLQNIPRHVAIIMDGNGRWAQQRGKSRVEGHRVGAESVRAVIKASVKYKLEKLTLFAFSEENWQRPKLEVEAIMRLLTEYIVRERAELKKNNISLSIIGDLSRLTPKRQRMIEETIAYLKPCTGLCLTLALSYSGRAELIRATKKIARAHAEGHCDLESFTQADFAQYLDAPDLGEPDFMIRTSGELRISNFLLWQLAYAELYFTDTLWPDFREADFSKALAAYQLRDRRYGGIKLESSTASKAEINA